MEVEKDVFAQAADESAFQQEKLRRTSLTFLAIAVRTIPVGTGYAIWTGIGAVGTAILGVILFAEPLTAWRVICLLLILGGVIGLKFTAA